MSGPKPAGKAGKKLYWPAANPGPDGPRVTLAAAKIHKTHNAFPFLKKWLQEKGAERGHVMTAPRLLPQTGPQTGPRASHYSTGYCKTCGLPAKCWVVNRRDHAKLAKAQTLLVDGQPLVKAPEGTVRYLFRGEGPALRVDCPGGKPKSAVRKTPPPIPPPAKKEALHLRIDMTKNSGAVVTRAGEDTRFVVEVYHNGGIMSGDSLQEDKFKLWELIEGVTSPTNCITIRITPNELGKHRTPKQRIDNEKFYDMLFGSSKTPVMEKIDTEV